MKVTDPAMRRAYAYLEAWVSIVGNIVLALMKLSLGLWVGSISLLADAAHTVSDVLTSFVVIIGFKISTMPADEEHPFGHGRAEFLSTLGIAFLLGFVGFEFAKSSYQRLVEGAQVSGNLFVAAVMVLSSAVKEWMTRFALFLGEKSSAPSLIGDALHHRTDAVASLLVAVAIASAGFGYHKVDAILGLFVSALIIYTAVMLGLESSSSLIGEGPSKDLEMLVIRQALSCPFVQDAHEVKVHDYGDKKAVSLHISVDPGLSVEKSHDVATSVENAVKEHLSADVVVHVEPHED